MDEKEFIKALKDMGAIEISPEDLLLSKAANDKYKTESAFLEAMYGSIQENIDHLLVYVPDVFGDINDPEWAVQAYPEELSKLIDDSEKLGKEIAIRTIIVDEVFHRNNVTNMIVSGNFDGMVRAFVKENPFIALVTITVLQKVKKEFDIAKEFADEMMENLRGEKPVDSKDIN